MTNERKYVGARYVPLIMGEWDNSNTYEPLSVVLYQGNSYTSRQFVPVGIAITNEIYWAQTGNYNAQMLVFDERIDALELTTEGIKTPQQFGAVGDGETDDTDAFEAMMVDSSVGFITLVSGVFAVKNLDITKPIYNINGKLVLASDATENDSGLIIKTNGEFFNDIVFDCQTLNPHHAIIIEGNGNMFGNVHVTNMTYNGVQPANSGVYITGQENTIQNASFGNFTRTVSSGNDSCPQCIGVEDIDSNIATKNAVNVFTGQAIRAGIVASTNGEIFIGDVQIVNGNDNGVYCTGGGDYKVDSLTYDGTEECLVVITDNYQSAAHKSNLICGRISSSHCVHALRFKNAGNIRIDNISMQGNFSQVITIDSANVLTDSVSIGSIYANGEFSFFTYLPTNRGAVNALEIGNAYVYQNYPQNKPSSYSFFSLNGVKKCYIKNVDITIFDKYNGLSNPIFACQMPDIDQDSYFENITYRFLNSNGELASSLLNFYDKTYYKHYNFGFVNGKNISLQGNTPGANPFRMYSIAQPDNAEATWAANEIVYNSRTSANNIFCWVNTTTGAATWKQVALTS